LKRCNREWAVLALVALIAVPSSHAGPRQVQAFDAPAWQALQAAGKPAVLVFSTTDCAHCPAVFQQLGQQIRQRQLKAPLVAVVMDVAPGEDDAGLLASPHHRPADQLMAFAGQPQALRFAVDPAWRGVTPYVVFLAPGSAPVKVIGPPKAAVVEAWARQVKGVR
jgi:hypothetical protein